MGNQEDNELVDQLREGSGAAFEQIFKKYWQRLYRLALNKLQTAQEAEEVVQELFASIWEKRERLIVNNL